MLGCHFGKSKVKGFSTIGRHTLSRRSLYLALDNLKMDFSQTATNGRFYLLNAYCTLEWNAFICSTLRKNRTVFPPHSSRESHPMFSDVCIKIQKKTNNSLRFALIVRWTYRLTNPIISFSLSFNLYQQIVYVSRKMSSTLENLCVRARSLVYMPGLIYWLYVCAR